EGVDRKFGKVFGDNTPLFNRRYKCLNLAIREGEDIENDCEDFRPVFYLGLRLKLLSILDKNPDVMLHNVLDEYTNLRSLIADSNMVESSELQAYLIKKPEIDLSTENNPMLQPQEQ
ncbi:unnamed protein product, partial [Hymenolepis diminuta]